MRLIATALSGALFTFVLLASVGSVVRIGYGTAIIVGVIVAIPFGLAASLRRDR